MIRIVFYIIFIAALIIGIVSFNHIPGSYSRLSYNELIASAGEDYNNYKHVAKEDIFQPSDDFIRKYDKLSILPPNIKSSAEEYIEYKNILYAKYGKEYHIHPNDIFYILLQKYKDKNKVLAWKSL